MMQVVPGSHRWFCRVEGCEQFTRHNIPYGYCDEHTRRVIEGETLAFKLGFPPMGEATPDPARVQSVEPAQESGSATQTSCSSCLRLTGERDHLREALRTYGHHFSRCAVRRASGDQWPTCDCGLAAALSSDSILERTEASVLPQQDRILQLAWWEANRRHNKASDADGYGASSGHAGLFSDCAHEDCKLVHPKALAEASVRPPREWLTVVGQEAELNEARETIKRLNRRCQIAEAAANTKVEDAEKRSKRGIRAYIFELGRIHGQQEARVRLSPPLPDHDDDER